MKLSSHNDTKSTKCIQDNKEQIAPKIKLLSILMLYYRKDILWKPETILKPIIALQPPYPIELLGLLLKRLLFKLIDEINLFIQPHLTASKAFQMTAYAAVNLGFNLRNTYTLVSLVLKAQRMVFPIKQ